METECLPILYISWFRYFPNRIVLSHSSAIGMAVEYALISATIFGLYALSITTLYSKSIRSLLRLYFLEDTETVQGFGHEQYDSIHLSNIYSLSLW